MKCAIIGLNSVGKTTLFKILTGSNAKEGNLTLYDRRVDELSNIFNPKKITHAKVEVYDFDYEFDKSENIQKLFLYDLLILVVSDMNSFNEIKLRMILTDLKVVEKRLENAKKRGNNDEVKVFTKLKEYLENEQFLSSIKLDQNEEVVLKGIGFITQKPFIVVYNVFDEPDSNLIQELKSYDYLVSNLRLEEEAMSLNYEERKEFLSLYGFEPLFEKLLNKVKDKLGIILFFTAGKKEVRSWVIRKGQTIKEAAGKIHSDLEKGFVRAEVISYEDFMKIKDMKLAKEKGLVRVEGKDYIVNDGDIVYIRSSI